MRTIFYPRQAGAALMLLTLEVQGGRFWLRHRAERKSSNGLPFTHALSEVRASPSHQPQVSTQFPGEGTGAQGVHPRGPVAREQQSPLELSPGGPIPGPSKVRVPSATQILPWQRRRGVCRDPWGWPVHRKNTAIPGLQVTWAFRHAEGVALGVGRSEVPACLLVSDMLV